MTMNWEETMFAGVEGLTPANLSPDYSTAEFEDENFLSSEINSLWAVRQQYDEGIKGHRTGIRKLDGALGQLLFNAKLLLAKPGRNGGWSSWLAERKIARATADRLVIRFAKSRDIDLKSTRESINEPSEVEISKLVCTIAKRIEDKLTTQRSRYDLVCGLAHRLGLIITSDDAGLHIADPSAPVTEPPVQEPLAAASSVEADAYHQVFLS